MSGVPRCPNPNCENLDFGSAGTNGMITCPSCDQEFDIDTNRVSVAPPKRVRTEAPSQPKSRVRKKVVFTGSKGSRSKSAKPETTKDGNRPKSPGRRSDRGDNRDPNQPYDPYGGNDA